MQETRPDFITRYELRRLRRFGCTRVQIGVQHVDDNVLQYINRGCTRRDAIKAIRMLKDAGFKVLVPRPANRTTPSHRVHKQTRISHCMKVITELLLEACGGGLAPITGGRSSYARSAVE